MAFYQIEQKQLKFIAASSFSELGIKERQDLQALLRDNTAAIGLNLFVFAEEFSNWQESKRRVDLLALDKDANLVVIELKSVEEGGHMELQALRYAAMLSTVDFPQIVEAYEKMLANPAVAAAQGIAVSQAERRLLDFLGLSSSEEVVISSTPRIILMAPSFSREMTTTILWLNERGLNITCLSVEPYEISGNRFLEIEQIIPLQSAASFLVKKRDKEAKAEKQIVTQKRRARTLPTLLNSGYIKPGDTIELIRFPKGMLKSVPVEARLATIIDENQIEWSLDKQVYSVTGLCSVIAAKFAHNVFAEDYAFAGPDNWALQGETMWLSDAAKAIEAGGNLAQQEEAGL